ncbi:hypothetical protein [Streptomyces vilmorinianum]|uniref:hypothetical protein n=1 Tax=Streptomyces vilmorinianum TaxID=3051092 RepID=UPI0010FAFFD4|nr:hypothetical protein [Streptomyces vilmorinianum]
MTILDERLFGHWYSGPFDVGAMETSELDFLPDGRGWSRFDSISSELGIGRFHWSCPGPGLLEIRYDLRISGTWDVGTTGFASVDHNGPDDEVIRTGYRIGPDTPPYGDESVTTLRLDAFVEGASHFARGRRDITTDDDVSAAIVPYSAR